MDTATAGLRDNASDPSDRRTLRFLAVFWKGFFALYTVGGIASGV